MLLMGALGTAVLGLFPTLLAETDGATVSGTEFTTVDAQANTYTERFIHRIERDGETFNTTTIAIHDAHGQTIRTRVFDDASWSQQNLTFKEQVRVNGSAYSIARYGGGKITVDTDGEYTRVENNTVYQRIPATHVNSFGLADQSVLLRLAYRRNGTVTWNDVQLERYDVIGDGANGLTASENQLQGYVLATPDVMTIRYANVAGATDQGTFSITYYGDLKAASEVPEWVATARELPARTTTDREHIRKNESGK